jgi:hypothetical protein
MTLDNIIVSPITSARLKPGASKTLRLSPSEPGDTAARVARVSRPARQTKVSSYSHGTPIFRASVLECGSPLPLFPLNSQRSTLNFPKE